MIEYDYNNGVQLRAMVAQSGKVRRSVLMTPPML